MFFAQIHVSLSAGAKQLREGLENCLNCQPMDITQTLSYSHVLAVAQHISRHTHMHHDVEDNHYFPVFARQIPALGSAFELLEGDHAHLLKLLDGLDQSVRAQNYQQNDQGLLDSFHAKALQLEHVLARHFYDEEEIIIPVLLDVN